MNHGTDANPFPEFIGHLLRDKGCLVDSLFPDLWTRTGMNTRIKRIGFLKRTGKPAQELVFSLKINGSDSIDFFIGNDTLPLPYKLGMKNGTLT